MPIKLGVDMRATFLNGPAYTIRIYTNCAESTKYDVHALECDIRVSIKWVLDFEIGLF
jgi:hypothetical protein